ncbi:hypothetical protein OIDMADRAFT_65474, partial [Oidiodendron maius Zn]
PQLSCELCRERKVKCDKLEPCTNCISSGVICVPIHRLRLPRGVHARSRRASPPAPTVHVKAHSTNAELNENSLSKCIQRLESLVDSLGSTTTRAECISSGYNQRQSIKSSPISNVTPVHASPRASEAAISRGGQKQTILIPQPDHSWADLVDEISELHDETTSNEEDEHNPQQLYSTQANLTDSGIGVLGLGALCDTPLIPNHFTPRVSVSVSQMCLVYLRQVDPVIKILHRPSLQGWLVRGEGYLGYPSGHASVDALSAAVCYSAASSMTENQCHASFHTNKSTVVADYRKACEAAMQRADLLATRDITVLQAFVLYLIARRSEDRSRAVWTLIAVAVSIAKSLCIYRDPEMAAGREESFFDQQMRRRLWLTTCLIDFQASFGLTSEPLISLEEATSSFVLPRHVNDADFDHTTQYPIPVREGLTDTTFALVTYHAQLSGRLLNSVAVEKSRTENFGIANGQHAASTSSNNASNIEAERQQHAQRFKQEALKLLHFCDPESSPYAWFTWHGTQCILAGVQLFELRPLQWARIGEPVPLQSAEDDSELLQLTLRFLEKAQLMLTDPRGEGFRWYIVVPWHALAIAIAQCYVCTDTALVRQVWPLIEASYHHLEIATAKSASGMQQHPLGKLMHQTREKL